MRLFDPHIHMTSRTTDDYQAMAAAGIAAIVEPAFWLGQPRTHVGTFEDYFLSLLGWERFRAQQFGIRHFCTLALNPKEANNPKVADGVLALLPRYLAKDGVVAVGEIGYDDQTAAEDSYFRAQIELAREFDLPVLIHTPHRDKKRGTERTLALVKEVGFPAELILIDHNNEETLPLVLETGCWAGHSIYPKTKMDEERMVALVKKYGARADHRQQRRRLGRQRSAQGAEDGGGHARGRASPRPTSSWSSVAQPGALLRPERAARPGRRAPMRPRSTSASCSRATRSCAASSRASIPERSAAMRQTLVLDVVGLAPKLLAHAPTWPRSPRAAAMRPLRTITPAVTCSVQSTFTTGLPPRPRLRRQRLVLPRPVRGLVLAAVEPPSCRARRSGTPPASATRPSPAPSCSGGTTCTAAADFAVTPRPQYPADGRKMPDIYTDPAELRDELQQRLGTFPLFNFWGPRADIGSSRLDRPRRRCTSGRRASPR